MSPRHIQFLTPHMRFGVPFMYKAEWFDQPATRIDMGQSLKRRLPISNMFTLRNELATFRSEHPDAQIFDASQGDGGASLGGLSPDELAHALVAYLPNEHATAYGQPHGSFKLREVLLENYWRLKSAEFNPEQINVCDGGRDALQKWYQAIHLKTGKIGRGLITSAAPWISYAHGAYVNGFNLLCAPANGEMDFRLTSDGIEECIRRTAEDDMNGARALILTTPDNPTGTWYKPEEILANIEHAYRMGIRHILIDLMYQLVVDDDVPLYNWQDILLSVPAEVRACVTLLDGLTKSVGASNVRMAHLVCCNLDFSAIIKGIASHTVLPNVLGEAVAYEVYRASNVREHPWVTRVAKATQQSRNGFRREMTQLGHRFVVDQGYYAFVRIDHWLNRDVPNWTLLIDNKDGTKIKRIEKVHQLGSYLSTQHGLAIVPGAPFRQPKFMRFSLANQPEYTLQAVHRFDEALKTLS